MRKTAKPSPFVEKLMASVDRNFPRAPAFLLQAVVIVLALIAPLMSAAHPAAATCLPVARAPGNGVVPAAFTPTAAARGLSRDPFAPYFQHWRRAQTERVMPPPEGIITLSYLGHSSFLITTPGNVTAITDYNGYVRAGFTPNIVTMNHAHESHYTDFVEPGVKHILRGWIGPQGYPRHDLRLRDMRVRNVATNIRGIDGGIELAGNSIFIFETNGLCVVHLGHLHHRLTPSHLGRIGAVDVLLAAIDDGLTMPQLDLVAVIDQLSPRVVVPMHTFDDALLDQFSDLMRKRGYATRHHGGASIQLSKRTLPRRTLLVLSPNVF